MYNQPWGFPQYPPQQPIYIPNPPNSDPVETITRWQVALEQMKKNFKDEKKDDDKKDKDKQADPKVVNIMLLMILVSPITGPIMSHFFQWGLSLLPH